MEPKASIECLISRSARSCAVSGWQRKIFACPEYDAAKIHGAAAVALGSQNVRVMKKSLGLVPHSTVFRAMARQDGLRMLMRPSLVRTASQGHDVAAASMGLAMVTIPFLGGLQRMRLCGTAVGSPGKTVGVWLGL